MNSLILKIMHRMKQNERQGESRVRENFMHGLVGEVKPVRRRGFTLIELLIVIAIIGILASLLLPSMARARRLAIFAVCKSNQKQFGTAVNLYTVDSDGILAHSTWQASIGSTTAWLYQGNNRTLPEHVKTGAFWETMGTMDVYHCPAHKERTFGTQKLTSYIMNGLVNDYSNKWYRITEFDSDWIVLWENHKNGSWNDASDTVRQGGGLKLTVRHEGPSAVTGLDGHTETMTNPQFQGELNANSSRITTCPEGHSH